MCEEKFNVVATATEVLQSVWGRVVQMGGKQEKAREQREAGQKRSGVCGGQRPFCLVAKPLGGTLFAEGPGGAACRMRFRRARMRRLRHRLAIGLACSSAASAGS